MTTRARRGTGTVARKQDRRVQRTQRLLRGALFELIQEKGFEALTVQDIIDRANVGRATFYAHFDNKEDLLVSGFEDLRADLRARQQQALARGHGLDERALGFSHEMFAHVDDHRKLFLHMVGKKSGAVVRQMIHKLLVDLVRDDVRALAPKGDRNDVPPEALVQFIAGGFFGLLMWWPDGKRRLSVEEIDGLCRRLTLAALAAATAS